MEVVPSVFHYFKIIANRFRFRINCDFNFIQTDIIALGITIYK